MKKITVPVRGMHCHSCEMLIEAELSKIPEVKKSEVRWKNSLAEIYYDSQKPNEHEIEDAIRQAGYAIGADEKKYLFSQNPSDYKDLGIAFLFLVGIYLTLKNFGLLNLNLGGSVADPSSLPVVLLIGLTAGLSTCMALVGGLILGLSTRHAEKHPEATTAQKFRPHLFFNAGRITSYAILGGVLGSLGSVFQLSNSVLGALMLAVGFVMLVMGLQITEMFPLLNKIKFTLPKSVSHFLGIKNHQEEYSHKGSFVLGALTFFLPCGFTQAMQLYAMSTGSFVSGALIMGTFALGTAPGLLGIGGITSVVKGIFAKRFFKFAGLVVVIFALFNISNGYNLTGWQAGAALKNDQTITLASDPNVTLENGTQIVRMKETSRGYEPNEFTIQKNIPVKWIVTAEAPYSCASSLTVSKLGIRKNLQAGESIIEFTPKETGRIPFSCSMGMYTGVFNVVDENGQGGEASTQKTASSAGGGCGGCGGGAKNVSPTEGKTETNNSGQTKGTANGAEQVIRTIYTYDDDIQPNTFTVKAGTPVKLIVDVRENGYGCMSTIMIPGLYNDPEYLQKGETIEMKFTPDKKGEYLITCAMGVPRGTLKVN